jgi:hypothetical protein
MSADQPAQCPECGEEAIHQPPAGLVPWEAHGIARPEWSHKDGSSLCPVIGQSGGYQPAQPEHRHAEPGVSAVRLDPPDTVRPASCAEPASQPAEPAGRSAGPGDQRAGERFLRLPAGTAGVLGRRYMTDLISRLGDMQHQGVAGRTDPEPEAGA